MSSASKISAFRNDKNNNLTEKQCEAFIKDYKEYKLDEIKHMNGMYYLCRDGITIFLYFNQKIEN